MERDLIGEEREWGERSKWKSDSTTFRALGFNWGLAIGGFEEKEEEEHVIRI